MIKKAWILFAAFGMIFQMPAWSESLSSSQTGTSEEALYSAHGRRDPFIPLISLTSRESSGLAGVESLDEVIVEGIVYDAKGGSIVIVNGVILKEGEERNALKVIGIKPSGAVLSVNGMEGFKPLYKEQAGQE